MSEAVDRVSGHGGLFARLVDHAALEATSVPPALHAVAAQGAAGFTTIFTGPGGESKLHAAAALAHLTGRPLYHVDAAQVVSKYIGETEKNLARIFTDANHSGAILFFDEADALFGKRTDVKDSHDRYASISADAFLQARQAFNGVVILDTQAVTPEVAGPLCHEVRFPPSGDA